MSGAGPAAHGRVGGAQEIGEGRLRGGDCGVLAQRRADAQVFDIRAPRQALRRRTTHHKN